MFLYIFSTKYFFHTVLSRISHSQRFDIYIDSVCACMCVHMPRGHMCTVCMGTGWYWVCLHCPVYFPRWDLLLKLELSDVESQFRRLTCPGDSRSPPPKCSSLLSFDVVLGIWTNACVHVLYPTVFPASPWAFLILNTWKASLVLLMAASPFISFLLPGADCHTFRPKWSMSHLPLSVGPES